MYQNNHMKLVLQHPTIWCWPADGRQKVIQKGAQNLKIMLLAVQLLQGSGLVGRAYLTCITNIICVFSALYLINNLILEL